MGQHKDFYFTRDIWQAAALDCYGIPFVRTRLQADGRVNWEFDNADDKAWQTGMEFRSRGVMMVPIQEFRTSFRKMSQAAEQARNEGFTYDNQSA